VSRSIRIIKLMRVRWAGRATHVRDRINTYKILVSDSLVSKISEVIIF
jgi:hypothetical protein